MSSYITGKYRKSIFKSNEGYIIGLFKVSDSSEDLADYIGKTITFTGYFHELNDMDNYTFHGKKIVHEKYGEQFSVESYERVKPKEKDSIFEFLTSGLFKGIGEAKAKKIIDILGENTLDTIINNPSNLVLIPGITEKNAKMLHDKLVEYEESYNIIIKLSDLGFNTKESMLIYNKYKNNSIDVVTTDIYSLMYDIDLFTFKRLDYIACNNKITYSDISRVSASIIYIIDTLSNTLGHSYFYKEEIIKFLPRVLNTTITEEIFNKSVEKLIDDFKIIIKDEKYYLAEMYEAEELIVNRLNILQHEKDLTYKNIDLEIERVEENNFIKYSEEQKLAIKESIEKHLLIITGGPGTGKTTIMSGILELYKIMNKLTYSKLVDDVVLLAPTGRAAKRMSEACNFPASTIHRFLKWSKDSNKFQVNEYNKSKAKFVIIDEASMIDTYLFANLLKGLSVNTKLIILGDVDQLPSVGPGNVLQDLIESNMLNIRRLNTLYRQKEGSNIITLAHDVKDNNLSLDLFNKDVDLTFIECSDNEVMTKLKELSKTYVDYSYKDFQILAPMYKTENGIDNINSTLNNIFNKKEKDKKEITIGEDIYREGDKVIQLTNQPDDNVYNGDIGIISKINNRGKKEIFIDFDDNTVKYTPANFINFKKAYAISIHKAQGSEFDIIIIPLVKSFKKMLYKKLIYTGITRSKKRLFLVGDYECLKYAVNNVNDNIRRTSIKDYLINGIN